MKQFKEENRKNTLTLRQLLLLKTKGDALKKFHRLNGDFSRSDVGRRILMSALRAQKEPMEKAVKQVQKDQNVFSKKKKLKVALNRELMMLNPLFSKIKELQSLVSQKKE